MLINAIREYTLISTIPIQDMNAGDCTTNPMFQTILLAIGGLSGILLFIKLRCLYCRIFVPKPPIFKWRWTFVQWIVHGSRLITKHRLQSREHKPLLVFGQRSWFNVQHGWTARKLTKTSGMPRRSCRRPRLWSWICIPMESSMIMMMTLALAVEPMRLVRWHLCMNVGTNISECACAMSFFA